MSSKILNVGKNLLKNIQGFHNEASKHCWEILKIQRNGELYLGSLTKLNILRNFFPKFIYKFNTIPINFPRGHFEDNIKLILKFE